MNKEDKTLYWNIGSQPGRAVKCLLDIGHVQCKLESIDLMSRQQKTKQYLQKYPLGKIPFFTKGKQIKIGQSNAIMIYLCQTQPTIPKYYYGQTIQKRAIVNQYLSWYQGYYRPKMFKPVMLFLNSFLLSKPIYENQKKQSIKQVHQALKQLDKLLQINNKKSQYKYLCGSNVSIADILLYFQTTNVVYFNIDYNQYLYLAQWFKNVYKIPQVKAITQQWYTIGKQFSQMFQQVQVIKSKL